MSQGEAAHLPELYLSPSSAPISPALPRTSLLLLKPKPESVATLGEVSCSLLQSRCAASVT